MNDKELEKLVKKEIKEATKLDKSNIVILVMYALLAIYFAFTSIILKEASWLCLAFTWVIIGAQEYFSAKTIKLKDSIINTQYEFIDTLISDFKKIEQKQKKLEEKMREYKFRGKIIYNFPDDSDVVIPKGKWTYGGIVYNDNRVWIDTPYYGAIAVDKETVGQYTGLKDKNGKEIYEGDIVKVFTNKEWRIGKIIYEHSEFTIDVTNNKDLKYGRTSIIENLTEVIGNIYDNKNLLEEGE